MSGSELKHSPLEQLHTEVLGARLTDFGGWRMPLRYTSDLDEHRAVRTAAGIFDLSHMGEIRVRGPQAGAALDHALAGHLSAVPEGRARYTLLLNADGGILDDLVVYHIPGGDYLVVANAANTAVDLAEITERTRGFDAEVLDETDNTALIAVQGPRAADIMGNALSASNLDPEEIDDLPYYWCRFGKFQGDAFLLARTGYTGEDGYELYVPWAAAERLWRRLRQATEMTLAPCGLASRDTLRLEAGMPLYGHELSADIRPSQAGLGRVVSFKKDCDFVGRSALEGRDGSADRVLVGLAGEGRRAARAGYPVLDAEGRTIGEVTSGVLSPTLGHPVAMAYLDPGSATAGTVLSVDVRGAAQPYTVVPLPFYRRA
ncbi:glycine cleavage system aminomethyltransferase GcvT [Acidipropionibacterium virtanenii]|uniref:Aminomethyltransferase n=1 Tax=Acidipropionibacterium virtanenii TaxID=2057246 RepID=A0A344UVA9_9ACTN|nr:glycine cleavage system aminomethyltransferase GcvT [Acidipropionibacterium virtanenii]AXE39207.1 Aminomethyltransferase [Acidipropionibacterium virtanenii]